MDSTGSRCRRQGDTVVEEGAPGVGVFDAVWTQAGFGQFMSVRRWLGCMEAMTCWRAKRRSRRARPPGRALCVA